MMDTVARSMRARAGKSPTPKSPTLKAEIPKAPIPKPQPKTRKLILKPEIHVESPVRSKRKRTVKYPYGKDFVTSIKRETEEEEDVSTPAMKRKKREREEEEEVSTPAKKRKAIENHEVHVVITDEQGNTEKILVVDKADTEQEHLRGKEATAVSTSFSKPNAPAQILDPTSGLPSREEEESDIDDDECEETFGKPFFVSKNKYAELSHATAFRLLNVCRHKTCVSRTADPKGGEAYAFDKDVVMNLWRDDGFEWQLVTLERKVEVSSSTLLISIDITPNLEEGGEAAGATLSRFVYTLESQKNIILVYYKANYAPENTEAATTTAVTVSADVTQNFLVSDDDYNDDEEVNKDDDIDGSDGDDLRGLEERFHNSPADESSHFDFRDALDMLNDCADNLSTEPPTFPKAGEVYFYDTNVLGDLWKFDAYVWRNCGRRVIPHNNPRLIKTFFLIRITGKDRGGSNAFRRCVYQSIANPNVIMVHYSGDETVFVPRPHGNSKKVTAPYTPSPSRQHTKSRNTSISHVRGMRKFDNLSSSKRVAIKVNKVKKNMDDETDESKNGVVNKVKVKVERKARRAKPLMITDPTDLLPFDIVLSALQSHADQADVAKTTVAQFPKGGEAYVYKDMKGWKKDGYKWADQRSTVYHPRQKPLLVRKIHCTATGAEGKRGNKAFQRCSFHMVDDPSIVFVHYIGVHTAAGRPANFDDEVKRLADEETENNDEEEEEVVSDGVEESSLPQAVLDQVDLPSEQAQEEPEPEPVASSSPPPPPDPDPEPSEEYVSMKLDLLNQQKKNLELQERKLLLEIKGLKDEKRQFYEQYGYE